MPRNGARSEIRNSRRINPPPRVDFGRGNGGDPEADEVARLAYFYWESRGCNGGSPEDDWFRAERELKARAEMTS